MDTETVQRHIDIGDHTIAYERRGSGPDLVFIHGWPLHRATWRGVVAGLERSYTCHLIDLPGCGDSIVKTDRPLRFEGHTDAVTAVIDRLGLTDYGLVGQDSGGMICRQVATARPDQVSRLVLIGTEVPNHIPWQLQLYLLTAKLPIGATTLKTFLRLGPLRRSPLALGGCFADPSFGDGGFYDLFIAPLVNDRKRMAHQVELLRTFDRSKVRRLGELHGRIECPTLFFWGERDPFFPVARARAMAAEFAGPTRFETVPEAKLFVHEEYPGRLAAAAGDFMAESPA